MNEVRTWNLQPGIGISHTAAQGYIYEMQCNASKVIELQDFEQECCMSSPLTSCVSPPSPSLVMRPMINV